MPATTSPLVLTAYYLRRAEAHPDAIAFHVLEGAWCRITWGEFVGQAQRLAVGLAAAGLQPGERIGIMAATGLAWEIFQLAALLNGAAVVGLDAHDQPARLVAIARASRLTCLVLGEAALMDRLSGDIPTLRTIIGLRDEAAPPGVETRWRTWPQLIAGIAPESTLPDRAHPAGEATLVFTSGSTGAPKGIAYTHAQVCLAIENILVAFPDITAADRLVCWLPLSNLFQRMLNFCAAGRGAQSYFVADPRTIMQHLPTIRPNVFIAVPRFFEKFNEGIEQQLAKQGWVARRLVAGALSIGEAVARRRRNEVRVSAPLAALHRSLDALVLRKLRAVLGGEVRFMVSGSAAFPRWLLERFHAMGLLVLEAYGLSENVVPIAINRTSAYCFGSVGQVLAANEVKIAEDGEVLVRSRGVFGGYLNDTAPSLSAEGFLATGDLGRVDAAGFLHLVGRKSEIFKTSTGRKIAPTGIEAKLKRIEGVDHAVIFGAGRKAIIALITLTPDFAARPHALNELARDIAAHVAGVVSDEADYLRPAGLVVSRRAFTIEGGELTSNLKLRRKIIEENYTTALDHLFSKLEAVQGHFTDSINSEVCIVNC